ARESLEFPNAVERVKGCIQLGEDARVFHSVSIKLIGADRRVAMLPLDFERLDGAALLVRRSSLLDALYELFESTWERATPISFATSGVMKDDDTSSRTGANSERLIVLLAAGLN